MTTTISLPGISHMQILSQRHSVNDDNGLSEERERTFAGQKKAAEETVRRLRESGILEGRMSNDWLQINSSSAMNHLFATSLASNAAAFTNTELIANIGMCFDMNEAQAFVILCDEATKRSLLLDREFFFEAVLQNKTAIFQHLCKRIDRLCTWPSPLAMKASPLAVLFILAGEDGNEHMYNCISELTKHGFIYHSDIKAVVACVSSVAQWKFVERIFGEHARALAQNHTPLMPVSVANLLARV